MTIRVGINGFGRIGRLVFRAAQKRDDIEIVGINDLIDVEYMAYMLRYDTMHGKFDGTVEVKDGKLVITSEGRNKKFLKQVEQVTFSGAYANAVGQPVLYVTERAVFKLTPEGLELIEVAPGIDIEKDVLAYMDFKPIVKDVKLMDARIFEDKPMGLEL